MGDNVNHPTHYNQGKIEVIDAIEDWKLNFHLGNAVKYVARADAKGKAVEDLKKALWYIEREIQRRKCYDKICSTCGWVGNSGTCECAGADPDELNGKKCPYWKPYDEPNAVTSTESKVVGIVCKNCGQFLGTGRPETATPFCNDTCYERFKSKGKPAGQYKSDKEFLQWVYDRMVYVHLENPSYDYMHRFKKILDDMDTAPQDTEQDAEDVATNEEVTIASALTDAFWRSQTVKMHDAELYDNPPLAVELFVLWLNLTNFTIVKKDKLNGATKA